MKARVFFVACSAGCDPGNRIIVCSGLPGRFTPVEKKSRRFLRLFALGPVQLPGSYLHSKYLSGHWGKLNNCSVTQPVKGLSDIGFGVGHRTSDIGFGVGLQAPPSAQLPPNRTIARICQFLKLKSCFAILKKNEHLLLLGRQYL